MSIHFVYRSYKIWSGVSCISDLQWGDRYASDKSGQNHPLVELKQLETLVRTLRGVHQIMMRELTRYPVNLAASSPMDRHLPVTEAHHGTESVMRDLPDIMETLKTTLRGHRDGISFAICVFSRWAWIRVAYLRQWGPPG